VLDGAAHVHPSGFYPWQSEPQSARGRDDQRLLDLIKEVWLESGTVYRDRKIAIDLRNLVETCCKHRVERVMKAGGLRCKTGYGRRPDGHSGNPSEASPNHLQRQLDVLEPKKAWLTDITYIRAHRGSLYLAVVLDLLSRQAIGWSTSGGR
jgi:putative transposase